MVAAFEDETERIIGSPNGEEDLDFKFLPAGGQFHLRCSDEALTAYGGLVAWDHYLERCGVFAELARCYPLPRTSPNATPVADILKAFSLNCLVGGTCFAHCRRLQDDAAVARITGMAWHKQGKGKRPAFLFKLKLTANARTPKTSLTNSRTSGASPGSVRRRPR